MASVLEPASSSSAAQRERLPSSGRSRASVVNPGNYDGVHLGHRALLAQARLVAERADQPLSVVVMTFDPHPTHLVGRERGVALLTEPSRRVEILRALGADEVVVKPFDAQLAALSPDEFAEQVLVSELSARAVVVGHDFRFGAGRAGDVSTLKQLGARLGFDVHDLAKVDVEGGPVSSSRIRTAIASGDVQLATRLLGRVHDVTRSVVRGDQRGRTIGVPTANLELPGTLLPENGVYAVCARILGEGSEQSGSSAPGAALLWGVANLGTRPTVSAGRSFEVHLLDFEGDIYDRTLRVGFVTRLRDERKFSDLSALKQQIQIDIETARERLQQCAPELLTWI
jgi:riboflavin kinase/FMN adenylyltransferase